MSLSAAPTTGTLTAAAQTVQAFTANDGWLQFTIYGTFGSFQGIFEGTPQGVPAGNWVPLMAFRTDGTLEPAGATLTPPDNTARSWYIPGQNMAAVRLRCTAITSGTVNVVEAQSSYFFPDPPAKILGGGAVNTTPATGSVTRMNAGAVAPGQTLKTFANKVALSATLATTVTLYTVTAGKTFYLTDAYLNIDTATLVPDVQIQAGGVPILRATIKGDTAPLTVNGIESQPSCPGGSVLSLVYPAVAGPPNGYYMIAGFEQ